MTVEEIWLEILGSEAALDRGFLENGGDSFRAVLLTTRLFEVTSREIDYLDVLEAKNVEDVRKFIC